MPENLYGVLFLVVTLLLGWTYLMLRAQRGKIRKLNLEKDYADMLMESLQATFEGANVYALNTKYEYIYLNKQHQEDMKITFGVLPVIGQNKVSLLPPALSSDYKVLYDKALTGVRFQHSQYFGESQQTFSFSPILKESNVVGITVQVLDSTELQKLKDEKEKLQSHLKELVDQKHGEIADLLEFYKGVFEGLPTSLIVHDTSGESILSSISDGLIPDDSWKADIENIILTGKEKSYETEGWAQDGSRKWLLLKKRPIVLGEKSYMICLVSDITHLKSTQRALEQSNAQLYATLEKLKNTQMKLVSSEKMASVAWLTSGLMHEINNAINYVAGSVNPLRRDFKELSQWITSNVSESEKPEEFLEILSESDQLLKNVEEGSKRVIQLVANLRAFSGTRDEALTSCDINECLRSVAQLLMPRMDEHIKLNEEYGDIPKIQAVASQLNQVFLNVLENAVEAIEKGGSISVRTYLNDEDNVVEITDNGTGVSEDYRYEIFDPFFTTKGYEKSGLGLAISKTIISQLGGNIEMVDSNKPGTVFRISIPVT